MSLEHLGNVIVRYTLYSKKHKTKKGIIEIYFRFEFALNNIWLTNKRVTAGLGIMCNKESWDGYYVKGNNGIAALNNKKIDDSRLLIRQYLQRLLGNGETDLATIIKEVEIGIKPAITGRKSRKQIYKSQLSVLQEHEFSVVTKAYIGSYEQHTGEMSENTKLKYDITVRFLKSFWQEKYKKDSVLVSEISINDTDEFKSFLLKQPKNRLKPEGGTLSPNTIKTYLSKLRAVMNFSALPIQEGGLGLIKHVPIRHGLIGVFDDSDREPVGFDDIEIIWGMDNEKLSPPLKRSKYFFLFMAGSGTGYKEVKSIKREHFDEVENGLVYLYKGRTKNNKKYGVTLLPFAVEAYNFFKSQPGFFDCITSESNEIYHLRVLFEIAGIEYTDVTPYVGRSTFIANLLAEGIDKYVVKDMVGHSGIKMLSKYDRHVAKIKARGHKKMLEKTDIKNLKPKQQ
ncbi:MAG: phage integrase SAM-like domain-containing protein [Chitinophagaceae bacterium]|nr:phage integrase SAM-like domain-containing protein [Chitinophagaceae bacterium]